MAGDNTCPRCGESKYEYDVYCPACEGEMDEAVLRGIIEDDNHPPGHPDCPLCEGAGYTVSDGWPPDEVEFPTCDCIRRVAGGRYV